MGHEIDVTEIELIESEVNLKTKEITDEIAAQRRRSQKLIYANSIKQLAESRAQTKATIALQEAEAYKSEQMTLADN